MNFALCREQRWSAAVSHLSRPRWRRRTIHSSTFRLQESQPWTEATGISTSRVVRVDNMPADMTMQHFLQFVRSGPLEDVKYDTRTRTAILSFLEPTAARNWVRQIRHRTGPEWLRSLCVALRPGTNPLPVELIALIATKSRLSRCLRVGAPSGTTEEDLRKQVERYGAEWCTDYGLNRLGERMMLLYYLTLRDSMNVS